MLKEGRVALREKVVVVVMVVRAEEVEVRQSVGPPSRAGQDNGLLCALSLACEVLRRVTCMVELTLTLLAHCAHRRLSWPREGGACGAES